MVRMSKSSLVNGVTLKVENRSGFDKSKFWAGTIPVGALVPLHRKLMIPSSGTLRLKISAQLPPLASDAYLRTHLKIETFAVPLRLCSGSFESWYCGREVYDAYNEVFSRADLPAYALLDISGQFSSSSGSLSPEDSLLYRRTVGDESLFDYLGVPFVNRADGKPRALTFPQSLEGSYTSDGGSTEKFLKLNIFPFVAYQLIYDEWYRNKFVERPLFSPPAGRGNQGREIQIPPSKNASTLPYIAIADTSKVYYFSDFYEALESADFGFDGDRFYPSPTETNLISDDLNNGNLWTLRYRNYGNDYFTAATPQAQEDSPVSVNASAGFSIAALRLANALQEFREANNYASPDYVQTNAARYGTWISDGVAQKPVLLGSCDIPMYTSGVEQNAVGGSSSGRNPFASVGARYGSAHAEGNEFICKFDIKEPSYLMTIVSLVPEASYSEGLDKEMTLFIEKNDLLDLPMAQFEGIGNEPIRGYELQLNNSDNIFGYVQRYLHHKIGGVNEIHGLYRNNSSLQHFIPQRVIASSPGISSSFLKVKPSDLDNVFATSSDVGIGVMIDAAIDFFVSEPLSESAIPSLVDPAREHGRSVYLKTGGTKL